uniref:Uncharacterized protein n=1 Tax=Anguilla anguilla TaxID=7936 RepID=A0A0E9RK57_ANGAN
MLPLSDVLDDVHLAVLHDRKTI